MSHYSTLDWYLSVSDLDICSIIERQLLLHLFVEKGQHHGKIGRLSVEAMQWHFVAITGDYGSICEERETIDADRRAEKEGVE